MKALWIGVALYLGGCKTTEPVEEKDTGPGEVLAAWDQRAGDVERGFDVLAYEGYVGCGIPARLMAMASGTGMGFEGEPLPGRDGDLPYYLTQFEAKNGVEIISPNCFACHAGYLEDQLVLGLGSTQLDFGGLG